VFQNQVSGRAVDNRTVWTPKSIHSILIFLVVAQDFLFANYPIISIEEPLHFTL
jgi:hypothetical protein